MFTPAVSRSAGRRTPVLDAIAAELLRPVQSLVGLAQHLACIPGLVAVQNGDAGAEGKHPQRIVGVVMASFSSPARMR